jgi:uncharacterized membrane protein
VTSQIAPPRGRLAALDIARGLALAAMATYHVTYDLSALGLAPARLPFLSGMRLYSHVIACAFLALVGVSLALAHGRGLRPAAYFRRLLIVAAAAGAVTAATLIYDPDETIVFGVLHCIVAASVLGGLCLFIPPWAAFLVGLWVAAAPSLLASDAFNAPAIQWLGLGTLEPRTLDWRPFAPWAAATAIALALTRSRLGEIVVARAATWRPRSTIARGLGFAGRHSLAIYLAHQPILFGVLATFAWLIGASASRDERAAYLQACAPACVRAGGEEKLCEKACACVADRVQAEGLMSALLKPNPTQSDHVRMLSIISACSVTPP